MPHPNRPRPANLYGVISVKALVWVVLSRCLFEGRPCPRLDRGNAEAIGSAVRCLSQVVVGTESIPRGARQLAQPIALAYLYSVGHGRPEPRCNNAHRGRGSGAAVPFFTTVQCPCAWAGHRCLGSS